MGVYRSRRRVTYSIIRWVLFRLEPERAHRLTIRALKVLQFWLFFKLAVFVLAALGAQSLRRAWERLRCWVF